MKWIAIQVATASIKGVLQMQAVGPFATEAQAEEFCYQRGDNELWIVLTLTEVGE